MNFNFVMAIVYFVFVTSFIFFGVKEEIRKQAPITYGEKIEYIEKAKLDQVCWVRALKRLWEIKADKDITAATMVLGLEKGKGHAWIEYQRGNEIIKYDPTYDKIIHIEKKEEERNEQETDKPPHSHNGQ